jgi:hypothetical protein
MLFVNQSTMIEPDEGEWTVINAPNQVIPEIPPENFVPGPMDQYFDEALTACIAWATTPPVQSSIVTRQTDIGEIEQALAAEIRKKLGVKPENPRTFKEALKGENRVHWMGAAKAERDVLEEKGVFRTLEETELEQLISSGTPILSSANVSREKINEDGDDYKVMCRAVKHGFLEREYRDFFKTFAAVASGTAIRTIVALGVGDNASFHHIDIRGAYLNADNPVKQYMWAPDGITAKKGECWEVLKSFYGGKGAGADWKAKFVPKLFEFGFRSATIDQTIFILRNPKNTNEYIIVAILRG